MSHATNKKVCQKALLDEHQPLCIAGLALDLPTIEVPRNPIPSTWEGPATIDMAKIQHVDAALIATSLEDRMEYLQSFVQFDPATDGSLIEACKPVLAPIVTNVVDAVYDHLLKFDITAAAFAPAQSSDGQDVKVGELHRDHANIKFRKDFLKGYLVRLVSNHDWTPSSKFWSYIDTVGRMHTGATDSMPKHRANKPPLYVEYREVNLLLGWVENAVTDIVMGVEALDLKTRLDVVKALNKYSWIQNDLFARHYVVDLRTGTWNGNKA